MAESLYDLELEAQQQALEERRALLAARAKQAAAQLGIYKPPEANTEEVGGFQSALTPGFRYSGKILKQPILGALTPVIQQARDAYQGNQLRDDEVAYRQREQADALAQLEAMPRATPATPDVYGAGDEGPTLSRGSPAKEPSLRDTILWAQRASANPSLKPVMGSLIADRIVKEPERQEAREERKMTREEARAEAQRKQAADIEFKRWQTEQQDTLRRDLAGDSNNLRRDLHAAIARSGGGGSSATAGITDPDGNEVKPWSRPNVKASDIVKDVASDGTITLTDKVSQETRRIGGGGRTSGAHEKDTLETRGQIERSTQAINNAGTVEKLLGEVSASGLKSDIRAAAGYAGYSDAATRAEKSVKPYADIYLKSVPRFEGPQSDKDTQSYKEAAADLANPRTAPEDRVAALHTVVRLHRQALAQAAARGNQPNSPRVPPTSNAQPAQAPQMPADALVNKWLSK